MINIVTKCPMSDLQMLKIKELKIVKVFVSMETKLSNHQRFYKKNCNSKANYMYLTSAKRSINNVCTF